MKIVVALDSFKGSLSADAACAAVSEELGRCLPSAVVEKVPMADGGEGTIEALVASCHGRVACVPDVTGPLPDVRCQASFGWLAESRVAVVEMARASGLPLLSESQRNPLLTTTFGTGELIALAAEMKPERILLTLGGSATVDGGTGAARALGWQFLDAAGKPVRQGGGGLKAVREIVPPVGLNLPEVDALCDVTNPLCGPNGAAAVYGPQKGATPEMVVELEEGLSNLAERCLVCLGKDIRDLPGAGAAGGFGAGAVAFFNARLVRGVTAVSETCGLEAHLADADWVVTGEGKFDCQSLQGKVVCGVLDAAAKSGTKVAVLAGRIELPEKTWRSEGVSLALPTSPDLPFEQIRPQAEVYLRQAARELAGLVLSCEL